MELKIQKLKHKEAEIHIIPHCYILYITFNREPKHACAQGQALPHQQLSASTVYTDTPKPNLGINLLKHKLGSL